MEQIELLLERPSVCDTRELGLTDVEAVTLPTACAAGNYAIGYGADVIRSGDAAFALVGGADAVCRKTFAGFYRPGDIDFISAHGTGPKANDVTEARLRVVQNNAPAFGGNYAVLILGLGPGGLRWTRH